MENPQTSDFSSVKSNDENETVFRKRKSFFDCGSAQKTRNKNLISLQLDNFNRFCNSIGLKIDEIILSEKKDNINTEKTKITILENSLSKEQKVFKCLMAKDLSNLSCRKYALMQSTLKDLNTFRIPDIKAVTKLQYKLNNYFKIQSNNDGFFVEPLEKIKNVCHKFLLRNPNYSKTKFRIKISADSTSISRTHINVLNFTFNLLDDVKNSTSVNGAYILGMFEIQKESRDVLKRSLKELLENLEKVEKVHIENKQFKIEFFLGSDYKMLRLLYGQKAANALEGCVWCKYSMGDIPKIDDSWPILNTLTENNPTVEPIVKFINFENCVVDLLHLLLRVTDQLYKLIILKFIRIDKNDGADLNLRPNLKIFLEFLKNKCKIPNAFYLTSNSAEKIKLRSFNGNERLRIFEELYKPYYVEKKNKNESMIKRHSISALFPTNLDPPNNFKYEDFVWSNFYLLFNQIKSFKDDSNENNYNPIQTSIEQLSFDLKNWLKSYMFINNQNRNSKKITPYIHVFVYHIPQMLEIHKNINIFNTQGLEKLNDYCTQYYHFCTNKHNEKKEYLNLLFKKRNRIEFFNLNGGLNEIQFGLDKDEDDEDIYSDSYNSDI